MNVAKNFNKFKFIVTICKFTQRIFINIMSEVKGVLKMIIFKCWKGIVFN
jgi:hypothetical protein